MSLLLSSDTSPTGVEGSDELLTALANGHRFHFSPHLGPGKQHLAALRRRGIVRHLDGPAMGLPVDFPEAFSRSTQPGRRMVAFALWDELEWLVLECFEQYDGLGDVPGSVDSTRPLATLNTIHIRAVMGWSQSYLNKYARQLPGRPEWLTGGSLEVDTVAFLKHVHHPQYPFMRRSALMFRRR